MDDDHSGYITADEILEFLDKSERTVEEVKNIFLKVDKNGDGKISKQEFVDLFLSSS